jgi:hypothetical protein
MTNDTIEIQSSYGTITIDQLGNVLSSNVDDESGLTDIVKFDLFECNFFWNFSNTGIEYGNQDEYDVCDLRDTDSKGKITIDTETFRTMVFLEGMRFTIASYIQDDKKTVYLKNQDGSTMFFDNFDNAEEYLENSNLTNYSIQVNHDNVIHD